MTTMSLLLMLLITSLLVMRVSVSLLIPVVMILLQCFDTIGADSIGAIPTAKKLWGRCPQVAPQEFYVAVVHSQKVQ